MNKPDIEQQTENAAIEKDMRAEREANERLRMSLPKDTSSILCLVACTDSQGTPSLVSVRVHAEEDDLECAFETGYHYRAAREVVEESLGYEGAVWCGDAYDIADIERINETVGEQADIDLVDDAWRISTVPARTARTEEVDRKLKELREAVNNLEPAQQLDYLLRGLEIFNSHQ